MNEIREKIPVTVLTGFLGSGKTTLLNRILSTNHGKKIAVIENEFGEIGIDQDLVIRSDEEVFELNNGCICCKVRGDLVRILSNLAKRKNKFDYVLIETTGLADPSPIAQTFFADEDIKSKYVLDGIVTVVDAFHVYKNIVNSSECKEQIAFADIIVLNKLDLINENELNILQKKMSTINQYAKVYTAINADIEIDKILGIGGFDSARALTINPDFFEEEYDFKWGAIYNIPNQNSLIKFSLTKEHSSKKLTSKQTSVQLCILPLLNPEDKLSKKDNDNANIIFGSNPIEVQSDILLNNVNTIDKIYRLYQINLNSENKVQFINLNISEPKKYCFYLNVDPLDIGFEIKFGNDSKEEILTPVDTKYFLFKHTHDEEIGSVGIKFEESLDPNLFNDWIQNILKLEGGDIFRMKGILNLHGQSRKFVYQSVHMIFDGVLKEEWGEDKPQNTFIFIGKNLNRELLNKGLKSCIYTHPS